MPRPLTTDGPGADICGYATVYWVGEVRHSKTDAGRRRRRGHRRDSNLPVMVDVLNIDGESGQIVVDTGAVGVVPNAMNFDSSDFFSVEDSPATLSDFVKALSEALASYESV